MVLGRTAVILFEPEDMCSFTGTKITFSVFPRLLATLLPRPQELRGGVNASLKM